jgi:hypothetical protein
VKREEAGVMLKPNRRYELVGIFHNDLRRMRDIQGLDPG